MSNEDTGEASIIDVAANKILTSIKVGRRARRRHDQPERPVGLRDVRRGQPGGCDRHRDAARLIKMIEVGARPRTIAFLPDSSRAYVTAENGGTVHVIDTKTHSADPHHQQVSRRGGSPHGRNVIARRQAAVHDDRAVERCSSAIDTATNDVVGSVKVGTRPWGVEITPDGRRLYTANGPSNDVSVVDAETMTVIATVPAGRSPWGVAIQ